MSQDIVADGLNQIMNARQIEKPLVILRRHSKVLINLFNIMRDKGHINYELNPKEKTLKVDILKLNKCRAVKPRYFTSYKDVDKYIRRFLPSRNFGTLIISTNKGLMTHQDAITNKLGGCLIAYFY